MSPPDKKGHAQRSEWMTYLYDDDHSDDKKEAAATQIVREGGRAVAEGSVIMNSGAFQGFMTNCSAGASDIWTQARLAGILAAKQADILLPIPYSVSLSGVDMQYTVNEDERRVTIKCDVRTKERIGAESSALAGCGIALMVLVNSYRAIDKAMSIEGLKILRD
jgi:cyclic pyranopterin monophosphate synthase